MKEKLKYAECLYDIRSYCYMCLKNNIEFDLKKTIKMISFVLNDEKEYFKTHEV